MNTKKVSKHIWVKILEMYQPGILLYEYIEKYPELWTSRWTPLSPLFTDGKNMAQPWHCLKEAFHQKSLSK